jgi:site-specific recombinase XerD
MLYVQTRKTCGYPTFDKARILNRFCRIIGPHRPLHRVRPAQVRTFLDAGRPVTGGWDNKYYTLRKFFRFAIARRWTSKDPLPLARPKRDLLFKPYIYSVSELQRLFDACDDPRTRWKTLHPQTFRTMAVLLYGAGLRLGEAMRLTHADLDFSQNLLTIRCSKFGKTRILPIGADLAQILRTYIRSDAHPYSRDPKSLIFAYQDGKPIQDSALRRAFIRFRTRAGIVRTDGSHFQPRIHDLRATFAVHRLTSWYQEGQDVQELLPLLSTYLGHVSIEATQVYLTMTPELLAQASRRFQRFAELPELAHA